jgi:ABC-type Fe3+-hydroxamate transport system substrate-binding protein
VTRRWLLVLAAAAGCSTGGSTSSPRSSAVDDFGDSVPAGIAPRRIVSLNPTTTELLFAMGEGARLVGRTHWDTYPAAAQTVPDLGPGIRPNIEAVLAVHPDLVLLYASADDRAAAERFRSLGIATLAVKVDHIADFQREARLVGRVLAESAAAARVVDSVGRTLARVRAATASLPRPTVFWELWESPLMAVGGGSFLDELLTIAGGTNVYGTMREPSPVVSREDVLSRHPDVIFASPTSAERFRKGWNAKVLVPDTALIGHPSVRLGEAAVSLAELLHPGVLR